MENISKIIILAAIILICGIGLTVYIQNKEPELQKPDVSYTDFNVTLPSNSGAPMIVDNFMNNPDVVADAQNPSIYFLGNTFLPKPSTNELPKYVITYERDSGHFNITLLEKPFTSARLEAELYLKSLLKVEESALCGLSYMVTVPGYVDEAASGFDYRFSFCPGGTSL